MLTETGFRKFCATIEIMIGNITTLWIITNGMVKIIFSGSRKMKGSLNGRNGKEQAGAVRT